MSVPRPAGTLIPPLLLACLLVVAGRTELLEVGGRQGPPTIGTMWSTSVAAMVSPRVSHWKQMGRLFGGGGGGGGEKVSRLSLLETVRWGFVGKQRLINPMSATNNARLTAVWEDEYRQVRQRDLADRDYVYVWVDGIHCNIRLEDDRLCTLVVSGARADGTKELLALEDGYRESVESWVELWRGLQRRRLEAPVVAVGDGALGCWVAVRDVWPQTAEQRDWFHTLGNEAPEPSPAQGQASAARHPGGGDARAGRGTPRPLRRGVRGEVSESGRVAGDRPGGAPDLLRLSGRTLDSSPDHERHRIAVRHGPIAATGHQGGRLPHQGPTDWLTSCSTWPSGGGGTAEQ